MEDLIVDAMTIRKSKGITADEVIIIGLDTDFPKKSTPKFWMIEEFREEKEEDYPYAEERRIFYVAITRAKNHVYLLCNEDYKKRSPFVNEIYTIYKEKYDKIEQKEKTEE